MVHGPAKPVFSTPTRYCGEMTGTLSDHGTVPGTIVGYNVVNLGAKTSDVANLWPFNDRWLCNMVRTGSERVVLSADTTDVPWGVTKGQAWGTSDSACFQSSLTTGAGSPSIGCYRYSCDGTQVKNKLSPYRFSNNLHLKEIYFLLRKHPGWTASLLAAVSACIK